MKNNVADINTGCIVRFLPNGDPSNYTTALIGEHRGDLMFMCKTLMRLTINKSAATLGDPDWIYDFNSSLHFTYEIYTKETHPEYYL